MQKSKFKSRILLESRQKWVPYSHSICAIKYSKSGGICLSVFGHKVLIVIVLRDSKPDIKNVFRPQIVKSKCQKQGQKEQEMKIKSRNEGKEILVNRSLYYNERHSFATAKYLSIRNWFQHKIACFRLLFKSIKNTTHNTLLAFMRTIFNIRIKQKLIQIENDIKQGIQNETYD